MTTYGRDRSVTRYPSARAILSRTEGTKRFTKIRNVRFVNIRTGLMSGELRRGTNVSILFSFPDWEKGGAGSNRNSIESR